MKSKKTKKQIFFFSIFLSLTVLIDGFTLFAQDAIPPDFDVSIQKEQHVPREQRGPWLEEQTNIAKSIYRNVQNMLDSARRERDTIKITCLDDKLTQINVNLRGVEERTAAFYAALSSNDNSSADQQFTVLTIYLERVMGLKGEAESCIGESDIVLGESETTVTIDEAITLEDPSSETQDIYQQVGTEQLPHASGFY